MQVRFLQNLGTDDARAVNNACKCDIDAKKCCIGAVVDIPESAIAWFGKKYNALFEPATKVKAVAKDSEITAPASK